jgi:RHS repeat-associated protein
MNSVGKAEANRVSGEGQTATSPPAISLPKGGGAIRGMGEKFAANPVTGTGSMTVPIATSPGRSGLGPQLALSYDSGAGNGSFGFGWSLSLASITRKTAQGLPKYEDPNESDVFILSGAEDLVPVFRINPTTGEFVKDAKDNFVYDEFSRDGYVVRRYRPRVEGLFARIERWTRHSDGDVYWRSISHDNITTFYGKTQKSRIANPEDRSQIFSWLICQSYDDKGNAIVYEYQPEDSQRIFKDPQGQIIALAHEDNRNDATRSVNRYLKRIRYGNRTPNRDLASWQATDPVLISDWMFEVVFDYGEGHYHEDEPDAEGRIFAHPRLDPPDGSHWPVRQDSFSTYRPGFEVRNYRLCRRVLMFHHFLNELGTPDYLVRSTDFIYSQSPIASFITEITQSSYVRQPNGNYLKKSLPPLAFEYSQAAISEELHDIDPESLQNLPVGANGARYQWLDLDGEGLQCVLVEQGDGWYYKRNVSPLSFKFTDGKPTSTARFDPVTEVTTLPSLAETLSQHHQFLDLAGDGQLDCVVLEPPVAGFFERTYEQDWEAFKPLPSLPNLDWSEPNLRFVDLTGDGHADILVTEDEALVWHPALEEEGFGEAIRIRKPRDEEKGPVVAFSDTTQAIFLADLSGDGLTDIVRIRAGEICYWPNLGYGRFGARVVMDNSPRFDAEDQFDQERLRLADIDGSGTTDIIYLHRDGVDIYRNQCGNSWSNGERLSSFPLVGNVSSVQAADLLGNGTSCLVWTSPLPADIARPMRYIDLMGGQKPHLLIKSVNNLGAETVIQYAPSTKFYLQDKLDGKPWLTRLPFPVHCVERVETRDLISRNRFVTRYAYHHGYFDGAEREFRGFGMVEHWDTEELGALQPDGTMPDTSNIDESSYVPPAYTKTWFHTGAYIERERISRQFEEEYYNEGDESEDAVGLTDEQLEAMLLPDTQLPTTLKRQDGSSIPWQLTGEEMREACRALKGAILRRETYASDGTDNEDRPYTATEQNYTIELLQPQGEERHAVFFIHLHESIDFHYERKLVEVGTQKIADPRVTHAMTLEVDGYGNVLKSVAIGYGRRPGLSQLLGDDKDKQEQIHLTYTENKATNSIDDEDDYRTPLPCEARTYELINITPHSKLADITNVFGFDEMLAKVGQASDGNHDLAYEDIYATGALANRPYRRIIEHVRTLYGTDDLSSLLPLGHLEPLALPGESYKLAFTPGLLPQVFQRDGQSLLPNPADVLGGQNPDQGGYRSSQVLKSQNLFPANTADPLWTRSDGDDHWWIPSGRVFYSLTTNDLPPTELAFARKHFFLPHRYRDPFHTDAVSAETLVIYDTHALLVLEIHDALENRITVGERLPNGEINAAKPGNDYRALAPRIVTDPNGNRSEVAFDALGLVAGSAVMGKATETRGDLLDGSFEPDPIQAQVDAFVAKPREALANANESVATQVVQGLLGKATTRVVYDLDRFQRLGEPPFTATITRETHLSELQQGQQAKVQISFAYSDGFGRQIQKKIQAEPGATIEGGSIANPRWVGSGWTIFNNKGKPVRQYEPFFDDTHHFKFGNEIGVSPVLFCDPLERVVATLHPNHTWEKIVFDPWQQITYDVNDTVLNDDGSTDPKLDEDAKGFFSRLSEAEYRPTWYEERITLAATDPERIAATKAAVHNQTPTVAHFDALGRAFLTVTHNRFERNNVIVEEKYPARVELDIEGNHRTVRDAIVQNGDVLGRIIMRYDYDMLGNRIHQASMEAGERWILNDAAGKPIRVWDSRGFTRRMTYDRLRRPTGLFVTKNGIEWWLAEGTVYGESQPEPETNNLRGKVLELRDQAGVMKSDHYDFKGNLLRSQRHLARDYKDTLDWSGAVPLEAEAYTIRTTYDAVNRPLTVTMPDGSAYQPTFNEANLLEKVDVKLHGAQMATPFVTNIDYNAKGQRTLIEYGNNAKTSYEYNRFTFRLIHLRTTRPTVGNGLVSQLFDDASVVQDLHYHYDPAGNMTRLADKALARLSNDGPADNGPCDYSYDAVYRLIEATGREHIGQTAYDFNPQSRRDYAFVGLADFIAHPNDLQAIRRYTERYEYDAVGNFQFMRHIATGGGWTRNYENDEASLIEPTKQSNRLTRTTIGNGINHVETYTYKDAQQNDVCGGMTGIDSMQMEWDFKDQVHKVALGGGGTAYYVYDSTGQRLRKVIETQNGNRKKEHIYLGELEIYREYSGDDAATRLERQTLHLTDNKRRIALVETKTIDSGNPINSPIPVYRYQLGNHLRSASLELDENGGLISYEEYHPYGTTAFQAVNSAAEISLKRYRYIGKERDEESGLYYHGARYYAAWIGSWTSCDPADLLDGPNLYRYSRNNPITVADPRGTQGCSDNEVLGITESGQAYCLDPQAKPKESTSTYLPPVPPRPGQSKPSVATPRAAPPKKRKSEPPKEKPVSVDELNKIAALTAPRYHYSPTTERVFGAGKAVGGLAQLGAALLLSETLIGGVLLGQQGLDDYLTGMRQLATGESEHTFKYKLGSWAVSQVTSDPEWQNVGGQGADILGAAGSTAAGLLEAARPVGIGALEAGEYKIPSLKSLTAPKISTKDIGIEIMELTKAAPAAERVRVYDELANTAFQATRGKWSAFRYDMPGGGSIFYGRMNEAMVIDAEGVMYRGNLTNASHFADVKRPGVPLEQATPVYKNLRKVSD